MTAALAASDSCWLKICWTTSSYVTFHSLEPSTIVIVLLHSHRVWGSGGCMHGMTKLTITDADRIQQDRITIRSVKLGWL